MNYLEIFKNIKGYETIYQISNLGNVKSLKNNKLLKTRIRKNDGYVDIKLSKNGKSTRFLLHRLIAIAFIDNPNNKSQINHKNGLKNDNRIENLEWCNNSENAKHAENNNLRSHEGIKNSHAKLNELDIKFIKYWLSKNFKSVDIAKHFNITPAQIGHIKHGRSWQHV